MSFRTKGRTRNSRGRFSAKPPLNVTSPSQIKDLDVMLSTGPITFVLIYADWCGHCQRYKPMWESLSRTPGRIANMAAVRDDMFPQVSKIAKAKIQGYPSVIKVSPNGSIEEYNVKGESTNAIDSEKMRDMDEMRSMISKTPKSTMASNMATVATPTRRNTVSPSPTPASNTATVEAKDDSYDIYTPVTSLSHQPGFKKGAYSPGSLLTTEDRTLNTPQGGGGLSVAAAFAGAIQAAGPAALLLAAHALLPKRRGTYKSPKRSSHRGGTRRRHRKY